MYTGGYHFLYMIYQLDLKSEMKASLSKNDQNHFGTHFSFAIVKDQITDTHFSWEEENEEFRFNNDLYDVVSVKRTADSIQICGLKDNIENNFEQAWNEIHHKNRDASSAIATSFVKLYCAYHHINNKADTIFKDISTKHASITHPLFCVAVIDVNTPPPKS